VYFQRFFEPKLASASYLIGDQESGEAIVVDPNRDIDRYVDAASPVGLTIAYVTETHIHADFVSGARALASRTGGQVLLPDSLADGQSIRVGNVRLDVMHTPGHTPEHVIFIVTDSRAARPWAALTGDFLFVGDVGRPDLLERAARVQGTAESGARALFASLRRFRALPMDLQIWPGHGAGSACGKALGAMPSTTFGYELATNWAFKMDDEETFVRAVLSGQPDPPRYFAIMKRVNRDGGPGAASTLPRPPRMPDAALGPLLEAKATIVDLRRAEAYAAGHVPGTINIPLTRSFPTWAGSVLPYDADIYLIGDDERATIEATHDLALIGLDRVAGRFTRQVIDRWRDAGGAIGTVSEIDARGLADALGAGTVVVLDVRDESEWDTGHLAQAMHLPLATLASRLNEVPRGRPIVVHCQAGSRSAIATSLLTASGIADVRNMTGGIAAWPGKLVNDAAVP
jgi:hydroxyacylglutathione hydrolase